MRFLADPGNPAIRESVLRSRMAIEILGFGILSAGNWGVFAAAHTDLFADRPSLSSRLQAADQMWRDAISGPASLAAAFLTPILWKKSYWWVLYAASAALGWGQLVVALMMQETLPEGSMRQKFSMRCVRLCEHGSFGSTMILHMLSGCRDCRRANPLANVGLLFRSDPGLRSLAAACSCYFLCQSNWSIAASYRMGVLGIFDPAFLLSVTTLLLIHAQMVLMVITPHGFVCCASVQLCRVVTGAIFLLQYSLSIPLVAVSTGASVAVHGPSREPQGV